VSSAGFGEFTFIAQIRERMQGHYHPGIIKGIADDCAVLRGGTHVDWLWTTDAAVEGVHFRRDWSSPYQIGWRAVMVNLSDIASMGGTPFAFLAALAFPPEDDQTFLAEVVEGLCAAGNTFSCPLVGGNLSQAPTGLSITITMLGTVEEGKAVYRAGAQVGDEIWVTGTLGDSYAGLQVLLQQRAGKRATWEEPLVQKYLQPTPRVQEAVFLRTMGAIHSMIDISDGLSSDLAHICAESGVGARLDAPTIPLSPEAKQLAQQLHTDPLEYALHGGEDFELCFTTPKGRMQSIVSLFQKRFAVALSRIGEIQALPALILIRDGREEPLVQAGYNHFRPKKT
jgi:thiamine-monophosphate kinase